MAEDTKIHAELELETGHAKSALHGLEEGFEHVHEKAQEAGHEFLEMAKQALATAAGFELAGSIEGIKEFGHEIFQAALDADEQKKAIAGVLAMNDKLGLSYDELSEHAKGVREDLDGIASNRGSSMGDTVEAFESIAARSTKSADQLVELTDKMATASRATRGGLSGLSEGFAMFEAGAMRARNPVVQLIAQTGVLKGNARDVAAALQKMKPEDAIKLGEEAIERMADKMKDVKPSFAEALTSVKNIREELMVSLGTPLLNAIKGPLLDFKNYIQQHRYEIEKYAKVAAEKIGEWAKDAAELMRDGFQAIQDHADEIRDALKDGWQYAKGVMEFVVAHKDLLKFGLEAYAGAKVAGGVGNALGGALGVEGGAMGIMKAGVAGGAPALGIAGGGIGAGIATLGALSAAIIAVAWASKQWLDVIEESGQIDKSQQDVKDQMKQLAEAGDVKGIDSMIASMRELDGNAEHASTTLKSGLNADFLTGIFTEDTTLGDSAQAFNDWAQEMHDTAENAALTFDQVKATLEDSQIDSVGDEFSTNAATVVDAYNFAAEQGNTAAQMYAAKFLLQSGLTADTLRSSGLELEGGFEEFQELFSGAAGETADLLKKFMDGKNGGGKFDAPQVHIGAGGSFSIKQDFRDSDPDRIVAIMKRDLVKAAEARHQSRFGVAFGGL